MKLPAKNAVERYQTASGLKPISGGAWRNGSRIAALIRSRWARPTRRTRCRSLGRLSASADSDPGCGNE